MKKLILVLSISLVLASGLLAWQDTETPHQAAARELLEVMQLKNLMTTALETSINAQVKANAALVPYKDVMLEWCHKYMSWEVVAPPLLALYADTFTEAELREMVAFYKTPTGSKAIVKLPELFQRGADIGVALAQEHQDDLMKMIADHDKDAASESK